MTSDFHTDETIDRDYELARERAEMLQGLYIHLLVFVVVNAGLVVINWATRGDGGAWWFYWPLLAWAIGLAIHVLVVVAPVFSSDWPERRARRMMERGQH